MQDKLNELNKMKEQIARKPTIQREVKKVSGKNLMNKNISQGGPNFKIPPIRASVYKNMNQKKVQDKKLLYPNPSSPKGKKNPEIRIAVDLSDKAEFTTPKEEEVLTTETEELQQPLLTEDERNYEDSHDYKSILKNMFKQLNDIGDYIIDDAVCKDPNFKENDLEYFLKYFEFLIHFFLGLRCKYHMDELGYLNIGVYAESEKDYISLAERCCYQLNIKILASSHETEKTTSNISNEVINNQTKHKQEKEKIKILKHLQLEEYDYEEISLYTPYSTCSKGKIENFRRYDLKDNFHDCP